MPAISNHTVIVDSTMHSPPATPTAYPLITPARRPRRSITVVNPDAPSAVPSTPAALGSPDHAGPSSSAATRVPIVLAVTMVRLIAAAPRNSATSQRRFSTGSTVSIAVMRKR